MFNFYANILEGRGNQDMIDARYVEGGKKVDKGIGFVEKQEAEQLYGISTPFMNFVFQTYLIFKKNNGNNENLISVLKEIIPYLTKYDKTFATFPIRNFDKDDVFEFVKKEHISNAEDILKILQEREDLFGIFKKFPSVAKNNKDIEKQLTLGGIIDFKSILTKLFDKYLEKMKIIASLPPDYAQKRKKEVIDLVFSQKNDTKAWEQEIENIEKIGIFERDTIATLIKDNVLNDTKILVETKNYSFLEIGSYEDMTWIGSHSKWCIARQEGYWSSLIKSRRGRVVVLVNWKKYDRDDEFMHVISDPFMRENGTIFYVNYGNRGFADMKDVMLKNTKEIEAVWLPFKNELSDKEYQKIINNNIIRLNQKVRTKEEVILIINKNENAKLLNVSDNFILLSTPGSTRMYENLFPSWEITLDSSDKIILIQLYKNTIKDAYIISERFLTTDGTFTKNKLNGIIITSTGDGETNSISYNGFEPIWANFVSELSEKEYQEILNNTDIVEVGLITKTTLNVMLSKLEKWELIHKKEFKNYWIMKLHYFGFQKLNFLGLDIREEKYLKVKEIICIIQWSSNELSNVFLINTSYKVISIIDKIKAFPSSWDDNVLFITKKGKIYDNRVEQDLEKIQSAWNDMKENLLPDEYNVICRESKTTQKEFISKNALKQDIIKNNNDFTLLAIGRISGYKNEFPNFQDDTYGKIIILISWEEGFDINEPTANFTTRLKEDGTVEDSENKITEKARETWLNFFSSLSQTETDEILSKLEENGYRFDID